MPAKKDPYSSPSQKALSLYSLLMFTGRSYSLSQLARELHCSKQTVIRMIEQISHSFGGKVESKLESGKRFYWMPYPKVAPKISLRPEEIQQLELCRRMVMHLLPEGVREQVRHTIAKTTTLLSNMNDRDKAFEPVAVAEIKGRIDYSPHQEHITTFIRAIQSKQVCEVTYHAPSNPQAKTYSFAPIKLISYHEALYVTGWRVEDKGTPTPRHSIMLAVHRLKNVTTQARTFDIPMDSGKKAELFGFMDLEKIRVKVKFDKETAAYIREREWSDDQEIQEFKNGNLVLQFTARSMPEVVSWVLGFGAHAMVMEPKKLKELIRDEISALAQSYL
jgi:predicted DNA-binding transcriptional regulator YafY